MSNDKVELYPSLLGGMQWPLNNHTKINTASFSSFANITRHVSGAYIDEFFRLENM